MGSREGGVERERGEGGGGRGEWGRRSGEGGGGSGEWGGRSPLGRDMKHCHVVLAYPCSPLKYSALFLTTSTTPS